VKNIEIFHHLYNGFLRFSPLKKYLKFLSNQKGNFPLVGYLNDEKKSELEDILNIQIRSNEIFEQALLHRSYLQVLNDDKILSNERLEFLGDAVLGMVVADYLFSLHTHVPEGELTKMRSWLVNASSLTLCARKLGLEKFIMMSYSAEKSVEHGCNSILADTVEALIGAIYLDSGFESAKNFILNSLLPIQMNHSVMHDNNYKSKLLESVQAEGKESPKYIVLDEVGPDHDKTFTIGVYIENELVATGTGKNKKQAEQSAAQKALEIRE
jgi:ribonuclease-3